MLERAFSLLKQRQITEFTSPVIMKIINGNQETLKQLTQKPRIVPKNSHMKMNNLLKQLSKLNPTLDLDPFCLDCELDAATLAYFESVGIESPLPL